MCRELKDSGIPWIGEIPQKWEVCRIKDVAMLYNGNSIKDEEKDNYTNPENTYPYISTKDIDATYLSINYTNGLYTSKDDSTFKIAQKGSCLMCIEGGSAGKKKAYVEQDVSFVNKLCCFAPHKMDGKYLFYYLCSPTFESEFYKYISGLIGGVSVSTLKNFIQLLPPLAEQQRIAEFLDRKCAEVDEMIALQEQIIEELKAYKQSVITEAVTKGLNPAAPMRDSGIEWIGQIPEHWTTIRIKYLLGERKERSEYGKEEPLSMSQKYGLIPTKEMDTIPNMASSFEGAKIVYPEDLVFNKLKAHLGVFATSKYNGLVSPDYAVYFGLGRALMPFMEYMFKTPQYISEFRKTATGVGSGLTRLYTSDLFSMPFPLPSIEEQGVIVTYIKEKCTDIDSLIQTKQSKIDSLKEYKKSIIYEYVTGKREVNE